MKSRLAQSLVALAAAAVAATAAAQSTLRIGMTAADIPATTSQPDSGFEGNRFVGLTLFDALTMWDLSSADKPSVIIPGLATEWKVDDKDKTKWIFKLRKGAKFHDGTDFNADAAIFNFDKVLKKDAPQYDPRLVAQTTPRMPTITGARKIDDYTIEVQTSEPDAFVPINLANLFMASPAAWAKAKNWTEFAKAPVGQRAVEVRPVGAARADGSREERRLLEPAARPEDRPPRADPDARGEHARGRAPVRAGRLDRGAAFGRDPAAPREGLQHHLEPLPAHVAVAAQRPAGLAARRQARAPGDAALRRPRRPAPAAGVHGGAGEGRGVRGSPVVRQAQVRGEVRPGDREEAARRRRLRPRQAGQGQGADLARRARARCSRSR